MGCVASKAVKEDFDRELLDNEQHYTNHVVSLTSSTYGVLNLDQEFVKEPDKKTMSPPHVLPPKLQRKGMATEPEVINAWELMKDLEDGTHVSKQTKSSPKSRIVDVELSVPSKMFDGINSSKKQKRIAGKENTHRQSAEDGTVGRPERSPKQVLTPFSSLENLQNATPKKVVNPLDLKKNGLSVPSGFSSSRKILTPPFDPKLLAASSERELSEEEEQIKKMIFPEPRISKAPNRVSVLEQFEKKCPPGGENAVVIYTTTLRGIRKTFEDCNSVRSVIQSHHVHMIERDISMDSGFREELRCLMGKKEVRVPVVFVKGRLIGGAEEIVKMEEDGKLGFLFGGIPRASAGCEGCGGIRFVMCMDCSGSRKILDEDSKKMVKCVGCNENGLIQCPICC